MYDYQAKNVDNIIEGFKHKRCVIDGSEAGSGKTKMSLEVCARMGKRAFILCGKHTIRFWISELKQYKLDYDIVNYECFKSGKCLQSDGHRTISFDRVRFKAFEANTLIIFDEIHICRNKETGMYSMFQTLIKSELPILGLSGTINKTKCDFLPDFAFVKSSFTESNIPKFKNEIIWLNKFEDHPCVSFELKDHNKLELRKIPLYIEYFEANKDKRVVMFCYFNETIRRLEIELKDYNPIIVNGINSDAKNAANIEKFQLKGGLLIINACLGGSSLNLQNKIDSVETVALCNINWSEIDFEQMIHRIYRVDSTSNCTQYILVTNDPLDRYMCSTVLGKRGNLLNL